MINVDIYDRLLIILLHKNTNLCFIYIYNNINCEAKQITISLGVVDKVEILAKINAFITLKDHKPYFASNSKSRLINLVKFKIGQMSKYILRKINDNIKNHPSLLLLHSINEVTSWFIAMRKRTRARFS